MKSDYSKGYEDALKDVQQEVHKAIYNCTSDNGKISAKYLIKELEVEVFPTLPPYNLINPEDINK